MKIGPRYKICRMVGERVFPKCQTSKFAISGTDRRRSGKRPTRGKTEYGLQLLEKQKARYSYSISEHQFKRYVTLAGRRHGNTAHTLYTLLERRLDNVVFRAGLCPSRLAARQAVVHGHITVNGRKVNIPSYQVSAGDVVAIRQESRERALWRELDARLAAYTAPAWLTVDGTARQAVVNGEPVLGLTEGNLNFNTIIEFYSRV